MNAAAADMEGVYAEVICPADLQAGRTMRIMLPDAREFDVRVPDDVAAGAAFLVGPFPQEAQPAQAGASAQEATEAAAAAAAAAAERVAVEAAAAVIKEECDMPLTKAEKWYAAAEAAQQEAEAKRRLKVAAEAELGAGFVAVVQGLVAGVGGEGMARAAAESRKNAQDARRESSAAQSAAALAAVASRIAEYEALAGR